MQRIQLCFTSCRRFGRNLLGMLLLGGLLAAQGHARGAEPFDWSKIDPEARVGFRSGATPTDRWGIPHEELVGYLGKPEGEGPFPAVILLHGWMGAYDFNARWVERLTGWGYVGLLVNSSQPNQNDPQNKMTRGLGHPEELTHHAYGALVYLRRLSFVAQERIALIAWGNGGMAALTALGTDPKRPGAPRPDFATDPDMRFRAGIAFYPRCPWGWKSPMYAPLLIILGGAGSAPEALEGCTHLATLGQEGPGPIRVKVYPEATAAFDVGADFEGDSWEFHSAKYSPETERAAIEEVRRFLDSHLR